MPAATRNWNFETSNGNLFFARQDSKAKCKECLLISMVKSSIYRSVHSAGPSCSGKPGGRRQVKC